MRLKSVLICAVGLYLFAVDHAVLAAPAKDSCDLPPGLREELSRKDPDTRPVTLADLEEYDRNLFQKDHGTRCPGLARVNFYGDGKPTWAVVLISGENPKRTAELVVARQAPEGWDIRSLDTADGTPVVWREGPGKYDDLYGKENDSSYETGYRLLWFRVMGCRLRLDGQGSREGPTLRLAPGSVLRGPSVPVRG
jgi:hypothetical protein